MHRKNIQSISKLGRKKNYNWPQVRSRNKENQTTPSKHFPEEVSCLPARTIQGIDSLLERGTIGKQLQASGMSTTVYQTWLTKSARLRLTASRRKTHSDLATKNSGPLIEMAFLWSGGLSDRRIERSSQWGTKLRCSREQHCWAGRITPEPDKKCSNRHTAIKGNYQLHSHDKWHSRAFFKQRR